MAGAAVKLFSKLKLQKLNSAGVAHHALIAVLVVTAFASFAAYRIFVSHAATYSVAVGTTQKGCELSGRVWDTATSNCKDKCSDTTKEFVPYDKTTKRPGYCKGYANIDMAQDRCNTDLHRLWLENLGCARRADQQNVADSRLCPDPNFPSYQADGTTDKCVGKLTTNPPADTTAPPTTDPIPNTTDPMSWELCNLLGRTPGSTANSCNRACAPGNGTLQERNGQKYCDKAVATNASETRCAELHRKWVAAGCVRRADQQDTPNDTVHCLQGYPYYNANFTSPNTATLTDVCEKNKQEAQANEQSGTLGGKPAGIDGGTATPPVDCANAPDKSCTTPSPTDQCGSDVTNQENLTRRCIVGGNPGTTTPEGTTYKITFYKDKNFKGDSMEVTSTVSNNTVTMKVKYASKEATTVTDLAQMPQGWNDKISSYKVQSGQWQLCPDANYHGNKKIRCAKVYAGDAELGEKLNDAISSARPVTNTRYEEIVTDETTEDLPVPVCTAGSEGGAITLPGEDGKCPDGKQPTCPADFAGLAVGYNDGECQLQIVSADTIVPVDKRFKGKEGKKQCELLGREWIEKAGKKDINGGQYGCSTVTCKVANDGRPRKIKQLSPTGPRTHEDNSNDGNTSATVCVSYKFDAPYAVRMDGVAVTGKDGQNVTDSKTKCDTLGRVWIDQVSLCAQVPNRKDKNQTVVNADQCASNKKDSYYIFKDNRKNDECFSPSYIERAQSVAKSTGGVLNAVLHQGPRAYCSVVKSGNYHWDKSKSSCVIDRHKCWNGQSIPVTQQCPPQPVPDNNGVDNTSTSDDSGATGGVSQAFCNDRHRNYDAASQSCTTCQAGYPIRIDDPNSAWDQCTRTQSCTPGIAGCAGPVALNCSGFLTEYLRHGGSVYIYNCNVKPATGLPGYFECTANGYHIVKGARFTDPITGSTYVTGDNICTRNS